MSIGAELYPFVSWPVTVAAASDITVSITGTLGNSTTVVTVAAGTYYTQRAEATWNGTTVYSIEWLHLKVTQALATATGVFSASGTASATGYAFPRVSHFVRRDPDIVGTILSAYIEGPEALMRSLGFHGTPAGGLIRIDGVTQLQGATFATTGWPVGIWAPMTPWSDVEVVPGYVCSQTVSPFAPGQRTVVELGARVANVCEWRHVPMRDITEEYAADSAVASVASASTSDVNGTLQAVVDAAVEDAASFVLVQSSAILKTCTLDWQADLSTGTLSEREEAFGGRRYTVTMTLVTQ
jgi:hypothetical protein